MKPLKFDPIEVCAGLTLCAPFSYPGLPPSLVMLETKNFGIKLTDASTTAALIAALQVAHKAQLEAETLTFADLKPGDWFRWAGAGHSSGYGLRKIDECTLLNPSNVTARPSAGCEVCGNFDSSPVVRVRATFEDVP